MTDEQHDGLQPDLKEGEGLKDNHSVPENRQVENQDIISSGDDDRFKGRDQIPEIATNDGSVIETLDTAFHGEPGWTEGENPSGSNRAGYYEARSQGKSDAEEEVDALREKNKTSTK